MEPPPNKLAKLKFFPFTCMIFLLSDQDEDYDPGFDEDIEAAIKASLDDQISEKRLEITWLFCVIIISKL